MVTLNNFVGIETGDLSEAISVSGTPTVVKSSPSPHSGDWSVQFNASTDRYNIPIITGGTTDSDNDFIVGFWINFADKVVIDPREILICIQDGGGFIWSLMMVANGADGDLRVRDANNTQIASDISDPFTVGTWHLVEVRWQHSASGAIDIHIDGVSVFSETAQDLTDGGTISADDAIYRFIGTSTLLFNIDDIYCLSGASGVSDFIGVSEIFRYQCSETNSATPDSGDNLDSGVWQDLGEAPVSSDASEPEYTTNATAQGGHMFCDGTLSGDNFRPGPSDDNLTGTIKGGKFMTRLHRSTGDATEHYMRYGNSVDTINVTADLGLTTAFTNHFIVSEAAGAVPLASEDFAIGFEKEGVGTQGISAEEMFCFILHKPLGVATSLSFPQRRMTERALLVR